MGTNPIWKALSAARLYRTRKVKKGKKRKSAEPRNSPFVHNSSGGALDLGKSN